MLLVVCIDLKNAPNMRRNAVVFWRPFSGKFREIGAKSFAPPNICLLLHLCLVPSVMRKTHDWRHHVESLVELLKEDLSSSLSIPLELYISSTKFTNCDQSKLPSSPLQALIQCDEEVFCNIFRLLKIAAALPLTTCEAA